MSARQAVFCGALLAALGVAAGAFGAHAFEARLTDAGQLENWRTAVRYQVWHALALIAVGLFGSGARSARLAALAFLAGSVLFSGSIYLLALDLWSGVVWPLTPLGGLFLIVGWLAFAMAAWRAPRG